MTAPLECAPWCESDHAVLVSCTSGGGAVTLGTDAIVGAYARRSALRGDHVSVHSNSLDRDGFHGSTACVGDAGSAAALAALLDRMADATSEQHRELAAHVRAAAALLGWGGVR